MKICFLMLSHKSGDLGGAEVQVSYIMEYFQQHTAHEVHFLCRKAQVDEENGIPIRRVGSNMFITKYLKVADWFKIQRLLDEIKPDVVYTRVWSAYVGAAAVWCKKHRARLIYHVAAQEDVEPFKIKRRRDIPKSVDRIFYEFGLQRAQVIAQAQYQDDLLQAHYSRHAQVVVANFHPAPATLPEKSSGCKVYWVANIKSVKRPELFIRLVEALQDCEATEFHMIGDLTEAKDYGQLIEDTQQRFANFFYHGQLPLDGVNAKLEEAHLFVNTSKMEGFPNTFIQAWLRGVPVVSLDIDPDDVIKKHELGLHSGSFERLVDDVRSLVSDKPRLETMANNGQAFARLHYGMQNCQKIVELAGANSETNGAT